MKSTRPKALVTRKIPEAGLALLRDKCDLDIYPEDRVIPRKLLLEKIPRVEGLLCLLSESIDEELLSRAENLKVVSNYAVGYDNIDVTAATRRGIVVTNTPGVLTEATADLTWALLLAAARRLGEGDRIMRQQKFEGWGPLYLLGQDITGKTLGILGAGRIGRAVVERSVGWKMNVLYFDNKLNSELELKYSAKKVNLDFLVSNADFISIHLPASRETHHLINERILKQMKKSAVLINTARGSLVDEKALVKALNEKWIAAAGLDVFENEPSVTEGLSRLENVVLAPHIGSATIQARDDMAKIAAANLRAVLEGKQPAYPVNPEVFS
ncbi:MAG: D-glycerate dehydrogenase [bacterium]|nr:MAG: D-glycerate dehydrogenase [bacterium]